MGLQKILSRCICFLHLGLKKSKDPTSWSYFDGIDESDANSVLDRISFCRITTLDDQGFNDLDPRQLAELIKDLTNELVEMFQGGILCAQEELDAFRDHMNVIVERTKNLYKVFLETGISRILLADIDAQAKQFAKACLNLDATPGDDIVNLCMGISFKTLIEQDREIPDFAGAVAGAVRRARQRSE